MMPSKPDNPSFVLNPGPVLRTLAKDAGATRMIAVCDENTVLHCLPKLHIRFDHTLVFKPGEAEKNLATAEKIWQHLAHWQITRKDLLVCVGGGVICDLGAFAASVYQRGMPFALVPTSLLAMTDAALGGKTGVNLGPLKNYVGSFATPAGIVLHLPMLETLDEKQMVEGWAEMIKHAAIPDAELWRAYEERSVTSHAPEQDLLERSMAIKLQIVAEDPLEKGNRKLLNFGHTLGHALESWHLEKQISLPHGEAVAAGMWMEAWLSETCGHAAAGTHARIAALIDRHFPALSIPGNAVPAIAAYCRFDKKNEVDRVLCTLLRSCGEAIIHCPVSAEQIESAIRSYCAWER
jgi:3-dehydroquinate synthase